MDTFIAFTENRIGLIKQSLKDLYAYVLGTAVVLLLTILGIIAIAIRHWLEICLVFGLLWASGRVLGAQTISTRHEALKSARIDNTGTEGIAHIGVVAHVINPLDINLDPGDPNTQPWHYHFAWVYDREEKKNVRVMWAYPTAL